MYAASVSESTPSASPRSSRSTCHGRQIAGFLDNCLSSLLARITVTVRILPHILSIFGGKYSIIRKQIWGRSARHLHLGQALVVRPVGHTHTPIPGPCMKDPRAVLAPAWCMTSAWERPRSRRSGVSHACHVRVPRPRSPLTLVDV
jgi:hypothetical protein